MPECKNISTNEKCNLTSLMRVLLVEDSQRLRTSIGKALRRSGYAVDTSGDGEGGLWLAESNDYDAIILDIMLPKMDGLTLLRRLRQQGRRTSILLLTCKRRLKSAAGGARKVLHVNGG